MSIFNYKFNDIPVHLKKHTDQISNQYVTE
jgi:hypothetical protein